MSCFDKKTILVKSCTKRIYYINKVMTVHLYLLNTYIHNNMPNSAIFLHGIYTFSAKFNSGFSDIPRAQKQSIRLPVGIDGTTPQKRWRNITTDVDDGYVNWASIHETNKRFSIVVCPKEGSSEALTPIPSGVRTVHTGPQPLLSLDMVQNEHCL